MTVTLPTLRFPVLHEGDAPTVRATARQSGGFVEGTEQTTAVARIAEQCAFRAGTKFNRGVNSMKTSTVLAIAIGIGALAACNKSPQQQAADNYESNVDNAADQMQANADNVADNMTATADNTADAMKANADNKADAMKAAADNKADAMANNKQ
jgi:hypothetical protein